MGEERGTVHSRLRRKRLKKQELFSNKAEGDRISALPDSLLLHIMSFLSTKEVVKTSLLSQRWQFLWTNISEIDLDEEDYSDDSNKRFFVDCVGKLLLMCGGTYLTKFAVSFLYDECFSSDVNTWLRYAVKNKVENIALYFDTHADLYMLPQILYSHSYLTSLTVLNCDLAPRGAIKWRSLKSLCIVAAGLEECVMGKILSGCPVLEVLHLKRCWGLKCLNISSPSLATLVIDDWDEENEENNSLAILAPYVLDLSIVGYTRGYEFRLLNVSSIVRAKLCFDRSAFVNHADPSIPLDQMKQLLESLKSVKELELGRWCIEDLSVLEVKGWQFPPSTRSCLTLEACSDKRSIPGILGILKSSPNLETLVIKGNPIYTQEIEPEITAYLHNAKLDLVAFHMKTVKITRFTESSCSVEPMATLVQILLKGATVLEKMVISAKELDTNKSAVTLISFPRASPKAVIVFD